MRPPLENVLRNALVQNLELIEPGLRPVQFQEYPLPNAHGTRGSIDILARDRHQMWVVIELKRSRSSARQALHEVNKYTELLCREKNLAPDRIRAVIVAMPDDWEELLIAVSHAARDWSHDLRGYRLFLDSRGTPTGAERVELLPRAFEPRVTPIHNLFFFTTEEQREQGWRIISKVADELGALDLLAADLDRVAEKHYIPAPFGLYLAIGRVNEELAAADLLSGYDGPEPFAAEHQAEYLALCAICNRLARSEMRGMNMESAQPGLLKNLADNPNWAIQGFRGTGAYDDTAAFEQLDLFRFLTGDERGDSQVLYTGTASPQVSSRWQAFRQEIRQSLAGNHEWESLMEGWLDEVSPKVGDGDVGLHVYNPCDLLQAIIHGWPDRMEKLLPMVMGEAVPRQGLRSSVRGVLCWNGRGMPLPDAVRLVYRDPLFLMSNVYAGTAWERDRELLDLLGLHYVLLESIGPARTEASASDEHRIWMHHEQGVRVYSSASNSREYTQAYTSIAADGEIVPVRQYLARHSREAETVAREYRAFVHAI
ncbi:endonuclease NucS [Streptomyces sp. NBC_01267]|uniref:endonuclease NucS domain-containing protein n=1 Tax=unclassified Streptomyces TaxID=2593676 RepID=UPI00225A7C27|nr:MULTISPECIES: endonuclease NucS domain-containing protein [unclassified Streptomyces]MCX4548489.1 endonuclease NucS [Streptomyces sp. NBC_01500]